ncbi:MurR/RpiR family transcriptional regulator [Mangrovitalea sediminis]|uniref:MurR/RpiR family transcriptional regulator n=1 Tax=Mangrovitalea sediminis TaxID=1982043 RepID=UPI0013042075|nr:MurR/RpiR family transcriptional regulator [Mangrovitalea sediminis]
MVETSELATGQAVATTQADQLLKALTDQRDQMTPQLQRAASYILEHPVEVALLSIRKAAAAADVTPSTLTRLAKELGFLRYDQFRQVFQDAVQRRRPVTFSKRAISLQDMASASPDNEIFFNYASAAAVDLEQFFQPANRPRLQEAAKLVVGARRVYAIGFRDTFSCAYHFAYVGRIAMPNVSLVRGLEGTLLSELAEIGPKDVVVAFGFNPYSTEIVKALEVLRDSGARLIVITDTLRSPLAGAAEIVFTVGMSTPHYFPTILASMALVEVLLAECVSLGGPRMLDSIKRFETRMDAVGGYIHLDNEGN